MSIVIYLFKMIILLILLCFNISLENTILAQYHNLFKGNLIKINIGTPPQFLFAKMNLRYNVSFLTPNSYKSKLSSSFISSDTSHIMTIDNIEKEVFDIKDIITFGNENITIENFPLRYIENVDNISTERLSFGLTYEDTKFSLVHTLYEKGLIESRQFGFGEQDSQNGKGLMFFGRPISDMINDKKKGTIKVNRNEEGWSTQLSSLEMYYDNGTFITYTSKSTRTIFDIDENTIYVPVSFMKYLKETIFKDLIADNYCTFNSRFNNQDEEYNIECLCTAMSYLPNFTFVFDSIGLNMNPTNLFEEAFGCCYFLLESNKLYKDTWVLQSPFINQFTTVFDYDKKEISFYSKRNVVLFKELPSKIAMSNVMLCNIFIMFITNCLLGYVKVKYIYNY